jgi:hypothetical protein
MASNFYVKTSRNVGTTFDTVGNYTVAAATQTTVIGLAISNNLSGGSLSAAQILVDAVVNDGTNDTYIIREVLVPGGSTIVLVGGDQKIVLNTGYSIKVKSNTTGSADVIMSFLELT